MQAVWLLIGLTLGAAAVALALWPRLVRTRADLDHEQARAETDKEAQARLLASFKALSAEALSSSLGQLSQMAHAQLKATQAEAKGELQKRRQAVEQLGAPLKEQLGRVDQQLKSLDQERSKSHGRLEAQLRTLTETGEKLRSETGALVTALRKPNARGRWGQMQLRNVVELAGMVRHWLRRRGRGWQTKLAINGVGACTTALVTLIMIITKFTEGAWLVLLLIPLLAVLIFSIHAQYTQARDQIRPAHFPPDDL